MTLNNSVLNLMRRYKRVLAVLLGIIVCAIVLSMKFTIL